jgi:carboxyl-terminal processing protease
MITTIAIVVLLLGGAFAPAERRGQEAIEKHERTAEGHEQATAGQPQYLDRLPLSERVWVATQIYSSIQIYFGHWRGAPDLDLDKEFRSYLDQVLATDDRHAFDLATMEFTAKLRNGHSGFADAWLHSAYGQQLGFYAYPIDGRWVVVRSAVDGLRPGDVITRIDSKDIESFFQSLRKYIFASDERWARRSFLEYPFLFPRSFSVQLTDGRTVAVVRKGEFRWPGSEHTDITAREEDGFVYIRIPTFADPKFEKAALERVRKATDAKPLVLDVRGNHGGSTPGDLVEALMDRPFRWYAESTPFSAGLFKYQGSLGEHSDLYWYGSVNKPSGKGFKGPVYILVDGGCFSACEDFVLPFKDNHRATIIGETSAGSTGQPFGKDFGNGMGIGLSTKREFFPDGSQFEGVGITPDVIVKLTADDLRAGRDPVLSRAKEMIAGSKTSVQKSHQ